MEGNMKKLSLAMTELWSTILMITGLGTGGVMF
jgi:hypothetical protein